MKKIAILGAFSFIFVSCSGQDIAASKVPSVVQNAVTAKYPGATKLEWKKMKADYEAEFRVNDTTEINLLLNSAGEILGTKHELRKSGYPATLISAIQKAYPKHKVDDVDEIKKGSETYYQVELDGPGKDIYRYFDASGNELKGKTYWD